MKQARLETHMASLAANVEKGLKMKTGIMVWVCDAEGTEAAIAKAGKMGLRGIEVFDRDVVPYYDNVDAFRDLLQSAGLELSGIYFLWGDDLNPQRESEICEKAQKALSFLREVNCKFIVLNAGIFRFDGNPSTDLDFKTLAKWCNMVGAEARKQGIQAVLHPHYQATIETNEDVERLMDAGLDPGLVGLCVHAGHQLMKGADPYEMYEKHASWIKYAHISDHSTPKGAGAFMGEGILDQHRLMKPLIDNNFDGWIIIESRKEGVDAAEYVPKTLAYLKAQWPNANWE